MVTHANPIPLSVGPRLAPPRAGSGNCKLLLCCGEVVTNGRPAPPLVGGLIAHREWRDKALVRRRFVAEEMHSLVNFVWFVNCIHEIE